jgi:hypothetical protein
MKPPPPLCLPSAFDDGQCERHGNRQRPRHYRMLEDLHAGPGAKLLVVATIL